jgi:hypothetical protein
VDFWQKIVRVSMNIAGKIIIIDLQNMVIHTDGFTGVGTLGWVKWLLALLSIKKELTDFISKRGESGTFNMVSFRREKRRTIYYDMKNGAVKVRQTSGDDFQGYTHTSIGRVLTPIVRHEGLTDYNFIPWVRPKEGSEYGVERKVFSFGARRVLSHGGYYIRPSLELLVVGLWMFSKRTDTRPVEIFRWRMQVSRALDIVESILEKFRLGEEHLANQFAPELDLYTMVQHLCLSSPQVIIQVMNRNMGILPVIILSLYSSSIKSHQDIFRHYQLMQEVMAIPAEIRKLNLSKLGFGTNQQYHPSTIMSAAMLLDDEFNSMEASCLSAMTSLDELYPIWFGVFSRSHKYVSELFDINCEKSSQLYSLRHPEYERSILPGSITYSTNERYWGSIMNSFVMAGGSAGIENMKRILIFIFETLGNIDSDVHVHNNIENKVLLLVNEGPSSILTIIRGRQIADQRVLSGLKAEKIDRTEEDEVLEQEDEESDFSDLEDLDTNIGVDDLLLTNEQARLIEDYFGEGSEEVDFMQLKHKLLIANWDPDIMTLVESICKSATGIDSIISQDGENSIMAKLSYHGRRGRDVLARILDLAAVHKLRRDKIQSFYDMSSGFGPSKLAQLCATKDTWDENMSIIIESIKSNEDEINYYYILDDEQVTLPNMLPLQDFEDGVKFMEWLANNSDQPGITKFIKDTIVNLETDDEEEEDKDNSNDSE